MPTIYETAWKWTQTCLDSISEPNRALADIYIKTRRQEGRKPTTLMHVAYALRLLDAHAKGEAWANIQPGILRAWGAAVAETRSPRTAHLYAVDARTFYKWLHEEHLGEDEIPRPTRKALTRKAPPKGPGRQVISEERFAALLAAAEALPDRQESLRVQACLWILWDTGMRASELASLRICDFRPDSRGGAYYVMDPGAEALKTGARDVYAVASVRAVTAWLAAHPLRDDPEARLIPTARAPYGTFYPASAYRLLKKIAEAAGVEAPNPHLFRHTAATRDANRGWSEAQLCKKYGWRIGSKMPRTYVQEAQLNLEARVRADAQVQEPAAAAVVPQEQTAAFAQLVSMTVAQTLQALGVVPKETPAAA